ncbi:CBS domain-containing protein [Geobacter pelophilus]|uniref:CBS domain-containing protein n=1 Tax=Geoanaerobacter pelophilus TaxID=60036 RepID=A0AAW4L3Z9_9BACT|nr:A-adding tRNA nucleotidyltransferase [Geoanaerobacter pelophilus]MBT0664287.1 CBS domain-containing protein [Geoanaerobacter pelophilus]
MDVITTHLNADFDCLGAMIAAHKLYPEALMVFSGSQEKSMRDFFLKSSSYVLNFTRFKDLDLGKVTRLILVDCQHSSRIGRFAELLERPGIAIHIYDHHPESSGDIKMSGGIIRDCGSSTAILCRILEEREIAITPIEATLMMLGIYEDTGSLTFVSTTEDDFMAAAWLLRQGGSLSTVGDFMTQELTSDQVSLLNDLLKSLQSITLNGVEVSIAHSSVDYYIGDIAILAHMMRDMENLEALFLVVEMGNRVYIVARSRIPEVNVGDVLRDLGGGGHATAASATIKELTLIQVLSNLEKSLRQKVNPRRVARDIMSSPVKTMTADTLIAAARELLTRYNVNAMPVMSGNKMIGIISRRIVEKALYHSLGQLPVSEYMHTEFLRTSPDTPIQDIQEYFIRQNRRFAPVFAKEELIGVITRTDLLRSMYAGEALYDLAREDIPTKSKELARQMKGRLSPRVLQILSSAGKIGDELDLQVYAVGGFVRDLLLGTENLDIDITVEGDGILFAETFASRFGCRCKGHIKFGTAVIVFPDGFKIDVASTRLEYYETPAALPVVERSSLKMDLYRRDFTINTLAIQLNQSDFGLLIDYFGAQRDLQEQNIRVLHNLSFVEDPTRVFRAIRFEQRLGFHIARHTENLIKNAVKMDFLHKLGGKRLLSELVIIFKERDPFGAVERMANLGLLRFIHPVLKLDAMNRRLLEEVKPVISWFELLFLDRKYEKWVVYFLALCEILTHDEFIEVCKRLAVSEHYREKLAEMRRLGERVLDAFNRRGAKCRPLQPSEIYRLFNDLAVEVLLYLMARTKSEEAKKALSLYFTKLQGVHTILTGDDILALGVARGPMVGELLEQLLAARLNGAVMSRDDELNFIRQAIVNNVVFSQQDTGPCSES